MRRAVRWFLGGASAGIFLATSVLYVRSWFTDIPWRTTWRSGTQEARMVTALISGRVGVTVVISQMNTRRRFAPKDAPTAIEYRIAGFVLYLDAREIARTDDLKTRNTVVYVRVPYWFLLTSTAAIGAWCIRGIVRDRNNRKQPTACKSCGYDLRAGHDKCPECGGESHVPVLKQVEVTPRRL